jgi:dTDP-4-dehydrorhamnose reductase
MSLSRKKKIVILGSSGQLGHSLLATFQKAPAIRDSFDIITPDRRQVCLNSEQLINQLNQIKEFDYMVNCAAFSDTAACEAKENEKTVFQINAYALKTLAQYCQAKHAVLIHISTDYVFDGHNTIPYLEKDATAPLNSYGKSKRLGEILAAENGPKTLILRTASLFGPHFQNSRGGNFIEKIIQKAKALPSDKKLTVVNDQWMSPTSTSSLSKVIFQMIQQDFSDYGIYHVCSPSGCSWYDFTQEIFRLAHIDCLLEAVSLNQFPSIVKRPKYTVMNNQKVAQNFSITSWQEELERYLKIRGHI